MLANPAFFPGAAARRLWRQRPCSSRQGLGAAALIEAASGGDAESPQIAFDASDNALAVWSKCDGIRNDIWANRYTVGSGWGTATLLQAGTTGMASHNLLATDPSGNALSPRIAFDGRGHAQALWTQTDAMGGNSLVACPYK